MTHIQEKQPGEKVPCVVDWIKRLPSGNTIATIDVKVYDINGADKSSDMVDGTPSISGTNTIAKIKAGTDAAYYNVEHTITTSGGYTLKEDIELLVRERTS